MQSAFIITRSRQFSILIIPTAINGLPPHLINGSAVACNHRFSGGCHHDERRECNQCRALYVINHRLDFSPFILHLIHKPFVAL